MSQTPNIVYILADDLGYGDVACLNERCLIRTPRLDRLAAEGMVFTDAHASSSVCTPSRYGTLTGRYNWRSRLQRGIVGVFEAPLIAEDRLTLPRLLGAHGYHTACIGKWHLGWEWPFERSPIFTPDQRQPIPEVTDEVREAFRTAFSKPIVGGPTTRGFDAYFGVDVPNWPPYTFIENDRVQEVPVEYLPSHLIGNNQASLPGPAAADWELEKILPTLADRACAYIADRSQTDAPFFLYMPLTSPHTPLAVNAPWKGASGLSLYADLVMETDDVIGRVLDALEAHGVADNTLVIFASDNGCAPYIGVPEMEAQGHFPSAHYRGYKADAWDGGHRIPLIARWPGEITPGSQCDQLVCLTDLLATCADLLDAKLPESAAEDSVSLRPLLQGDTTAVRREVVHHSINGKFAIRDQRWKLVLCAGSGGWASPTDAEALAQGLPPVQLYDMQLDPGETTNLQAERPELVAALTARLQELVDRGRTTPGPRLANDVPVDIHKR